MATLPTLLFIHHRLGYIKAVRVSLEIIIETLQEIINLKNVYKKTRSQALGLVKKLLSFDSVVSLSFMKNIMYKIKIL